MNTAVYDHEDGQHYVFNTIDETVKRDEDFQAIATITFSLSELGNRKFEVEWNSPKDITVSSMSDDEW